MKMPFYWVLFSGLFIYACQESPSKGSEDKTAGIDTPKMYTVTADRETFPVHSSPEEDAADDPAIWIDIDNPTNSLIIGTDKKAGICLFNLKGEEKYFAEAGNVNNIDLRYQFPFNNGYKGNIIGCSERKNNELLFFTLDTASLTLKEISGKRLMSQSKDEVYGFCLYHSSSTQQFYAFINDKAGYIEQWELSPFGENELTGKIVRKLNVSTQPEGMVADDELGFLYVGEEEKGIWKFEAEPDGKQTPIFIKGSDDANPNITYDIEGLALYTSKDGQGYLIASSQGNNSYAVFERQGSNKYLGSFRIGDGSIDGTQDTDGIDLTNLNVGPPFEQGVFIVQDGENQSGNSKESQNFKLVSWKKIAESFDPPLLIDTIHQSTLIQF